MAKELKILYFSAHSILEYQELKLFGELGHKWLSLGAYYDYHGDESTDIKRPPLPKEYSLFDQYKGDWNRGCLTEEQIEPFDVLIFMHQPEKDQPWITNRFSFRNSNNRALL